MEDLEIIKDDKENNVVNIVDGVSVEFAGDEFLGVSEENFAKLFFPEDEYRKNSGLPPNATKEEVASNIRDFIKELEKEKQNAN